MTHADYLSLAHWRRTTAELYAAIRQSSDPVSAWQQFVTTRNNLFKNHPQSPLTTAQRATFQALAVFPYDPAFRVTGHLEYNEETDERMIDLTVDGRFRYKRVACIHFDLHGKTNRLSLFWIQGYGGGLFLPFKDATNHTETFGGGRYLYDTIKGTDLGITEYEIMLDFNFAYNPSCAYNAQWICPLSPPENRLSQTITAGEKRFTFPS